MTKPVHASRARKCILLVATLLAPMLLAFAPSIEAYNFTCTAAVDHITVSPMYADPGDLVRISVFVRDDNQVANPQNTNLVRVNVKAEYSDGTDIFGTTGTNVGPADVVDLPAMTEVAKSFTVDASAAPGIGNITVQLLAGDESDPLNSCLINAQANTLSWGFWVGQKPDLRVQAGSVTLVRHTDGDLAPGSTVHDGELSEAERFTRYPNVAPPNTCFEENLVPALNVSRAHFQFKIENVGDADFKGRSEGSSPMQLQVRVRDGAVLVGTQSVLVQIALGEANAVEVTLVQLNYSLVNKPGLRNISIHVDSNNLYKETDENNTYFTPAEGVGRVYFRAPDLVPVLTGVFLRSDGKVDGTMGMRNHGDDRAGTPYPNTNICKSRTGTHVTVRAFLDRVDPANEIRHLNATLDPAGTAGNESQLQDFTTAGAVGAGVHKIIVVADYHNATLGLSGAVDELNETNNLVEAIVVLNDTRAPRLFNFTVPPTGRTGQYLNITGNVTDDANFTLDVNTINLDFGYPDGTNHTFAVLKTGSTQSGVLQNNGSDLGDVHWWFNSTYALEGDYTVRVRANDTINEVLSEVKGFTLLDYPKTMELVSIHVCRDNSLGTLVESTCSGYNQSSNQPANLTFLADYNQVVRIRYKVPAGATGLAEEWRNATRKTVEVRDRDGVVLGNFTPTAVCFNNLTREYSEGGSCANAGLNCEGLNFTCWVHTFQVIIGHGRDRNETIGSPVAPVCQATERTIDTNLTKPAQWNVTFWVGDAGCKFRGHTPDQQPKPVSFRFGLWDTVAATVTGATLVGGSPVRAKDPANFQADYGDNLTVMRTFLRVLRDGQEVMLEDLLPTSNVNLTGDRNGTYAKAFPTGIYTPLDQHGDYDWLLGAQDANLTISWNTPSNNSCAPDYGCTPTTRRFTLQDRQSPTLTSPGAHLVNLDGSVESEAQDAFQVGANLTLQVSADDDTRINVTAEVLTSAAVRLFQQPMTRVAGTLYRTENITTGPGGVLAEGEYRFVMRIRDSAGNVGETIAQVFRVASNLPPGFSARSPPDGGFGPPNGTVGVDITDLQEGILTSSVAARFGINTDAPTTAASNLVVAVRQEQGGRAEVVRASFQLPSSVRHGDRVVVEVSASDGGADPEEGNATWRFTIDGLAPRSTLTCTRAHPASCGSEGPQSVRGDTEFTLAAEDVDPENRARSGVASVRYAVDVAGSPGTLQVVQGPNTTFRLGAFAATDGFYTVRFRAVDAAGNEEPERRLVFALDGSGPSIQNVLVTPTAQGWNLTSTISDTASDVRSASVFFRAGATAFDERPLTKIPDTTFWFGNVPGARRGAQVCYYLQATDFLDNVATNGTAAAPVCFASENHPPALTVLNPREGEAVTGDLTVRWQVSDLDADPVTVSLAYRRSGDITFTPIPVSTEELGQRTKLFDVSSLVAGTYAVRVEAADNQAFNNRTTVVVNVTLGGEATGSLVPRFDKATVAPGEPVVVRVELARPAVDVEARLLRGSEVVQTQPMEQDPPGSRTWVAEFRIADPGVYQVEVRGEYEDGEPFVIRAASALTVTGGGLGVLDLALMGALTAAVVVLAALGLRRRGWL